MMNKKDTSLLVESWRKFINENEDKHSIKSLGSNLKKYLNSNKANISELVAVDTDTNVLHMLCNHLRSNDEIEEYKTSLSGDLLETFNDLIERAPEVIDRLQKRNMWSVSGRLPEMLQK